MQNISKLLAPKNDIDTNRKRFLCPVCQKHTVLWLLPETEIKNLPIKCKRCGKESVVTVEPFLEG